MEPQETQLRRRPRAFRLTSPDQWMRLSHWYQRTLAIADVIEVLDVIDPTRALLPEFLTAYPPSRFGEQRWSLADIYNYLIETREQTTRNYIPRLFPTPSHPGTPARLLFAQATEIGSGGQEFVVHAWDPHDDRGHVAMAYPVRDCPGTTTPEAARQLLRHLSWASAVVVATDEDVRTGLEAVEPTVLVADGHRVGRGGHTVVERCTWGDVANLMRIDLPWWSYGLRDRDAMLLWRPDDNPRKITPGTAEYDPRALRAILTEDSSTALRRTATDMVREIDHDLCGSYHPYGHDHHTESLGLTHAATADMDYRRPRPERTAGETALFLHQEIANPLTAAHAAAVAGGHPIAHSFYIVKPEHHQYIPIQEWLSQLRPASRRDEIGFQLALSAATAEIGAGDHLQPTGYFVDPRWPDCWIISQGDVIIVTCGTAVPARGRLTRAYVADRVAFFTDSEGYAWPVPYPRTSPTHTAETWAQTLSRLMLDASADVENPDAAVETNIDLWQHLHSRGLPLVID